MPRSKKRSFAISNPVMDIITIQRTQGIIQYPSDNAAVNGLILYQGMVGKDHSITSKIAYMHKTQQDAIHDFIRELNVRGLSLMGSFIRKVAERVAAGEAEPDADTIVKLQAEQILSWALRWQRGDVTVWKEIEPTPPGQ